MTIDDGYRDTLQWAHPILNAHRVPFAVYIPTSFPDRLGELWWLALEAVVARNTGIQLLIDGKERASYAPDRRKSPAVRGALRLGAQFKTEDELRRVVRDLAGRYQVDIAAFCENFA